MSSRAARESKAQRDTAAAQRLARSRARSLALWAAVLVGVVAIVAVMLVTSRPRSTATSRPAPSFVLTSTSGQTVSLSAYRGQNVLLYFNEGAGCQACLVQMAQIEKEVARFDALDLTVLPIVMNTREQIMADMRMNGVRTPFLLDDGTVSKAYGTLGKGMHAGLPGHSFVLVDRQGRQRWYGEYPSMWLAPDQLLGLVKERLAS